MPRLHFFRRPTYHRENGQYSNDVLIWAARRGAEVRWNELQAEVASLLEAFPDLATVSNTARRTIAKLARRS